MDKDLEEMSQSELENLEDEMVADEVKKIEDEPEEGEQEVKVEKPTVNDEPSEDQDKDLDESEDLSKHVSPPSKWAKQRQEKNDLKSQLSEATEKLKESDGLQEKYDKLEAQVDWLKTAIKRGDSNIPENPMDAFSDEKIASVREEHGDEMADMLQAAKASIVAKNPVVDEPTVEKKPAAKEEPAEMDTELVDAIEGNNELSYWRENSPKLWDMAVAADAKILADPLTTDLSYEKRFTKVVEAVKKEVMEGAKAAVKEDDKDVPDSLSGHGAAPTIDDSSALEKILSTSDLDKQNDMYNSLPEKQRDEIDKALGI